jgi:hypothetical protein
MRRFFYRNRNVVLGLAILLIISGAIIGYVYYGTEPHETFGGVLCGLGVGVLVIYSGINS